MSGPLLSIVTGHWNRHAEMTRLARWVMERTPPVQYELLVCDCSDTPFDPQHVSGMNGSIRIIRDWPKTTMAKGYELAFTEARGEFVLWLNDDAEPMPGYAQAAVEFMQRNPNVGLGALYWCHDKPPYRIGHFPQGVPYANFGIIRKQLGDKLAWFDSDLLDMYGSDNALALKVWLDGMGVVGIPDAKVINHNKRDAQRRHNESTYAADANEKVLARYRGRLTAIRRQVLLFESMQGPLEIA